MVADAYLEHTFSMTLALPAIVALLLWWFATGTILFLIGLPAKTHRWSLLAASLFMGAAFQYMRMSSLQMTAISAYTGFGCAIAVWAWLEMTFLTGHITGSRKTACRVQALGMRRFLDASQTVIHNEIATLAGALCVTAATWRAPNQVALWTYLILWGMRLSAKLNLFLGVPNPPERFLPVHLEYLASYFRRRPLNLLYPLSVAAAMTLTVLLARRTLGAQTPFEATANALLTSLAALGTLEHYFMILPLPSDRLWNWALRSNPSPRINSAP